MHDNMAAALRDMRDQLAAQQREMIAVDAATIQLLAKGRATLEQGRNLIASFNRATVGVL